MTVREAVYDVKHRLKKNGGNRDVSDKHIKFLLGNFHAEHLAEYVKRNGEVPGSAYKTIGAVGSDLKYTYDKAKRLERATLNVGQIVDLPGSGGFNLITPDKYTKLSGVAEYRMQSRTKFFNECEAYYRDGDDIVFHQDFRNDQPITVSVVIHANSKGMDDDFPGPASIHALVIDEAVKRMERAERYEEDQLNDGKEIDKVQ